MTDPLKTMSVADVCELIFMKHVRDQSQFSYRISKERLMRACQEIEQKLTEKEDGANND